jgi:hypothetical protein
LSVEFGKSDKPASNTGLSFFSPQHRFLATPHPVAVKRRALFRSMTSGSHRFGANAEKLKLLKSIKSSPVIIKSEEF